MHSAHVPPVTVRRRPPAAGDYQLAVVPTPRAPSHTPGPDDHDPDDQDPDHTPTGDPSAAAKGWQTVLPHQARLLALACRCGATADTARDIVQEALLRTATCAHLDPARAGGYLTAVVCRLAADQHRATQREQHLLQHRQLHVPHQPGPEETVCQQAEAAWLHQQTRQLRDRERRALLLRGAGRTTRQIATELDTTPKAAELLLRHGRATLKLLLASTLTLLLWTAPASPQPPPHHPTQAAAVHLSA